VTVENQNTILSPLKSLEQISGILGVHRTTVARYVHSGELRCVSIGRRLMFDDADVLRFIEDRKKLFENSGGLRMVGKEG
jgi:excisionase family DNA binding protein